nr:hypothetical protein [Tanacetum cinerariifolium]
MEQNLMVIADTVNERFCSSSAYTGASSCKSANAWPGICQNCERFASLYGFRD